MDDPRFAAAKRFAEEDGGGSDGDGMEEDVEEAGTAGEEDEEEEKEENADGDAEPRKKKRGMSELSQKKLERIKANIEKTGATAEIPPVAALRGGAARYVLSASTIGSTRTFQSSQGDMLPACFDELHLHTTEIPSTFQTVPARDRKGLCT